MVGMLRLILLGFRQDRKDKEKDKVGGVGSGNPALGGGGDRAHCRLLRKEAGRCLFWL